MAFPFSTAGSLSPTFVPARLVGLAVKHPFAFALCAWFPSKLRVSLGASVTLSEATAPVKLPDLTLSRQRVYGVRLEIQYNRGGIPTAAPTTGVIHLFASHLSCTCCIRIPISSWSKAPWGLSVQSRVTCIFTGISISPGP